MSSFINELSWQTSITNELRSRAERCGLAMPQTATLMMDSANTIERLKDENIKFRELVRHMNTCMHHHSCTMCEYDGDACDFEYDMRELGMEFE